MSRKQFTFLCLFSCLFSLPADAFIFIRAGVYANKGERPISRAPIWATRTVTFYVNPDQTVYGGGLPAELSSAEFQTAVSSAINQWASLCNSDIQVKFGGTTTNTHNLNDGMNVIVWDDRTIAASDLFDSVNTLAAAWSVVGVASDTYSECDIAVNGDSTGDHGINGEALKYDLISTLVHEIGHCLGLDHTVEPPTWTASNPILLSATMKSTVTAGDTEGRSISQDEKDAMECVNPTGSSFRTGSRCSSYHGTNGGGGLSGIVGGGPAAEIACTVGAGTSASISDGGKRESGGGCLSKAVASDGRHTGSTPLQSWLSDALICLTIGYFAFRRPRRKTSGAPFFIVALMAAGSPSAHALVSFEFGPEARWTRPTLLRKATEITAQEGTFAKIEPKENYSRVTDIYAAGLVDFFSSRVHVGAFARYLLPSKRIQQGRDSSNFLRLTKTTELTGFGIGPMVRVYVLTPSDFVSVFGEAALTLGRLSFAQSIEGASGADKSTLAAGATSFETLVSIGASKSILPYLHALVRVGYSRFQTNALSAESVSGTRYVGVSAGRRLYVNDGGTQKELSISRSGVVASLGLMVTF